MAPRAGPSASFSRGSKQLASSPQASKGPSPARADPAAVRAHVSSYAVARDGRAAAEVIFSLLGYFSCFLFPLWSAPLHVLFTMRVFVVCVHDTAHGACFSSKIVNDLVGTLTAPLCGMTYGYWRSGHSYHHHHSNDLDFLQTAQTAPFTSRTFAAMPAAARAVYRVLSVPIALMTMGSPFVIMIAQPLSAERAVDWALQIAWWAGLYATGLWRHYLLVGLMTSGLGLLLFHAQHTFPECVRTHGKTTTIDGLYANAMEGSSHLIMNEFLRFFSVGA